MVFKGLKKLLGIGLLAGSLMLPNSGKADILRIYNSTTAPDVDTRSMYQKHLSSSVEGYDSNDRFLASSGDPIFQNKWLDIFTSPFSTNLYIDSRSTNSSTIFNAKLSAGNSLSSSVTCDNRLKFSFTTLGPSDPSRIYLAKIHLDGKYMPTGVDFDKIVNIRDVIANDSGYVNLPGITNVTNNAVYGSVDVSCFFLDKNPTNNAIEGMKMASTNLMINPNLSFTVPAQVGSYVRDKIQINTNAISSTNSWSDYLVSTNYANPTNISAVEFSNGWKNLERIISTSNLPSRVFFRISREVDSTNSFGSSVQNMKLSPLQTTLSSTPVVNKQTSEPFYSKASKEKKREKKNSAYKR